MSHNYGDTIPLNASSAHLDMDEIESLMYDAPSATILPAAALPYARPIPSPPAPPPSSSKPPLPSSSVPIFLPQAPTAAPPASLSIAIASDGSGLLSAATTARSVLRRAPLAGSLLPHLASSSRAEAAGILLRSAAVGLETRMSLHSAVASATRLESCITQGTFGNGLPS